MIIAHAPGRDLRNIATVTLLWATTIVVSPLAGVQREKRVFTVPGKALFRCSPKFVGQKGTVTLTFSLPHGHELGIRTPDNRFLFIAFHQETVDSIPPIAGGDFAKMRALELKVDNAKGLEYIGSSEYRRVFTAAGLYRFVLAENLETEADIGGHQTCEVRFSPEGQPSSDRGR